MRMASSDNNNKTLGIKHKEYNEQVRDIISSQKPLEEKEFAKTADDLDNLKKIDIASHNKDIDYILSVLKSDDMLYISRAIKQSRWIVDDQYANIINPEFLNEHLFPSMKTRSCIKLLKHIRHYLKNESRVEEFYKNETNDEAAAKWLSRCSISFIENNINKHIDHLTKTVFKRLCERSVTIFEVAMKIIDDSDMFQAVSFLLRTHTDIYLNVFEDTHRYNRPTFSSTATDLIMKKTPDRIINNFSTYMNYIDIPTFVQNLKREQVKDFLLKFAYEDVKDITEYCDRTIFDFKLIKQFVKRIPKEEQLKFVREAILHNEKIMTYYEHLHSRTPKYRWYEVASYNIAFERITKLIQLKSNISDKYLMYDVLLKCAKENIKDLLHFFKYYSKNSMDDSDIDDNTERRTFVNKIISEVDIYKYDEETWKALTNILNGMNIYKEEENDIYTQIIILHDILHNTQGTVAIEEEFPIDSLKMYRKKLNQDDQNKVFDYIYNHLLKTVQSHIIQTETELTEAIQKVGQLLNVLLDWNKELADYPFVLQKIKDLVQIRKEHSWKIDMSSLYNKKKSWKRLMFEESVLLNPSQNVFVNALKHDPGLLIRYKSDVDALCTDDAWSLKRLLRKIRIYWPVTLAESWTKSYLHRMDKVGGLKALTRGLCTLLSQEVLLDTITKYAPAQPKIDWNNTNELILGLQKSFAKNMHIARPQPSADSIILYAKGDFLQYALPSLLAIYYDMSYVESQEHIPKLLNAPVSLQKHGLRLAFTKLKPDELKFHLCNIWQLSKNISIRAVIFGFLFDLMCNDKNLSRVEKLWEVLNVIIENLSFKEDKKIYEKLLKINDVPETIKPKFLVKSYKFLKTLLPHVKIDREIYENGIRNLAYYTRTIMESMCPEFVADIINEHLEAKFCNYGGPDDSMLEVTSSYLLCAKDEETQTNKYNKIVVPLIKRVMDQWNELHKNTYYVRQNFQNFLKILSKDLEYVVSQKNIVPTKMFQNIQKELDGLLPVPQNYVMLRMWKLVVKISEIIANMDIRDDWKQVCSEMVTELGTFCLEVLKQDVKAYFPCIYLLFKNVLFISVRYILEYQSVLRVYEVLLSDREFVQAYLLIIDLLSNYGKNCYYDEKEFELKQLILENSSIEVKMHYYCRCEEIDCSLGI